MYESFWQLREKPFDHGCDPRFYFSGESHQAAILKLRYAIENRRGGAVLAGPSGSGKTLLVQTLRAMLAPQIAPIVHLVFPQLTTEQILAYLADELYSGEEPAIEASPAQNVRRIERFLAENGSRGRHALVVVDEAQLLDDWPILETLRLLTNFQSGGQPGLTLLLAGQPGILPMLDRMPQLEERLAVKCLLKPLSAAETAGYVQHRLFTAGRERPIFDAEALATLHRLTQGLPRRINRLCDLALLIGYAEQTPAISGDQLEAIAHELVAVVPE